jgi:membrane-associated phospholipid phosphatase
LLKNTSDKFAGTLSTLFVPPSFTILIFTYFALAFETSTINRIILILTALTFGFTFHIILFFYLRRKGALADSEASIKEERSLPYLAAILFYAIGLIILVYFQINIISVAFWFCYITNTFFIFLINKKWKISAHTMGAGGPLAAITYVLGPLGLIIVILLVAIGWARVKLKLHTVSQVVAGALLGFFSAYLQMYLIIHYFS